MEITTTKQKISSREIAQITNKNHKDLLRAIRNMEEAWVKVNGRNFTLVKYTDTKGEERPQYELTKTESLYIATKFNDEARAILILRWEELEKQQHGSLPKNFAEALRLAADQQEKIEEQKKIITEQAPKVAFTEAVIGSVNSCSVGELAKILNQNGFEIGRNRLFKRLIEFKFLMSTHEPYQRYIEQGLFELKKRVIDINGEIHHKTTVLVTGKGIVYFVNFFKKKYRNE